MITKSKRKNGRPLTVDYQEGHLEELKEPKYAAEYLRAAVEDGHPRVLMAALRDVADAQGGVGQLAAKARINRENLYRVLSKEGNPRLQTFEKLVSALGFDILFRPKPNRLIKV